MESLTIAVSNERMMKSLCIIGAQDMERKSVSYAVLTPSFFLLILQ